MMRKYLLPLATFVGISVGVVWFFRQPVEPRSPQVARDGGTELVFRVDGEVTADDRHALCEILQRRFDPFGRAGVEVAYDEAGHVWIRVPNGEHHDALVEQVRRIAARSGRVLVCAPAREEQDDTAWDNARTQLADPRNAARRARCAREDRPPDLPLNARGQPLFPRSHPDRPAHCYRWVRLNEAAVTGRFRILPRIPPPDPTLDGRPVGPDRLQRCLKTGEPFSPGPLGIGLEYAHRVPGTSSLRHFVLIREPANGVRIDEHDIVAVQPPLNSRGLDVFVLKLTDAGTQRLGQMLGWLPDGSRRDDGDWDGMLLFTVDDCVQGYITAVGLSERGVAIKGDFTDDQRSDLMAILRGALPVPLHPKPVRETILASGK